MSAAVMDEVGRLILVVQGEQPELQTSHPPVVDVAGFVNPHISGAEALGG